MTAQEELRTDLKEAEVAINESLLKLIKKYHPNDVRTDILVFQGGIPVAVSDLSVAVTLTFQG